MEASLVTGRRPATRQGTTSHGAGCSPGWDVSAAAPALSRVRRRPTPLLRDGHGAGRFQVRKEATCPTLTCPLGQLQEHWRSRHLPQAACQVDGFARCDRCHRPRLAEEFIFWTTHDVTSYPKNWYGSLPMRLA